MTIMSVNHMSLSQKPLIFYADIVVFCLLYQSCCAFLETYWHFRIAGKVVGTCCERTCTASACLALRRSTPFTDSIASPMYKPLHLSAGWASCISEMRMGTPCSLPPCNNIATLTHYMYLENCNNDIMLMHFLIKTLYYETKSVTYWHITFSMKYDAGK